MVSVIILIVLFLKLFCYELLVKKVELFFLFFFLYLEQVELDILFYSFLKFVVYKRMVDIQSSIFKLLGIIRVVQVKILELCIFKECFNGNIVERLFSIFGYLVFFDWEEFEVCYQEVFVKVNGEE